MPYTFSDRMLAKMGGLDVLAERLPQGKGRQSLFSKILARVVGV
jgi:sarcosine oxidase gamma subunit